MGVLSMCVFSIPRVFYRCPTTSVAPRLKNTCRPGQKFFHFQNHYRPCVGHATVCATLDCVHRVTVLCAVPWTLSLICDHLGVFGLCCATLFYSVLLCCALCLLCCVCLSVSGRRRRLVKVTHGRGRARPGPVTNRYQRWRPNQKPCGLACGKPYQSLPDPVLAVRNPLVVLVWSGASYHCLPVCRSGSEPSVGILYQSLPPRGRTGH